MLLFYLLFTELYQILFSTRFSTTFSTIFSTIFENIKRIVYQYLSKQLLTTKIFLHETTFTPPSFQIKVRILHRRCFQNHPLFTTFLLVFTMDELCYISHKYQSPSIFLHKKIYIPPPFRKKIGALHRNQISKHTLFTTFSSFLKVSEFVIIQLNADCLINQPIKYFCTRHLTIVPYFKKNIALSIADAFRIIHILLLHFYQF